MENRPHSRISPDTGRVTGWIDLAGLLGPEDKSKPVDVLNGIACNPENDRLFVTGKLWPKLFEIKKNRPFYFGSLVFPGVCN